MGIELKGKLDGGSLDEIFAILTEQNVACSFLVSDGVSEKIFYFSIGGIRFVALGGRKGIPLGDILVTLGRITPEQQSEILEYARLNEKRVGDAALLLGHATRDEVNEAVTLQVEMELCDLLLWDEAEFEFVEGQPPDQFYDARFAAISVSCDVQEFIRNVQKRRQQWGEIKKRIPSDRVVFELTDTGAQPAGGMGEAQKQVLSLVDGQNRIRDIVDRSGFPALYVFEIMYSCLTQGVVKKTGVGDGYSQQGREEIIEEIKRLEAARTEVVGDLILRTRLAKAYEQINENGKAAGIWKEVASLHRKKRNRKGTLEALRSAVRCTPQDFNCREQILEIYRVNKDYAKLLQEGRILADMLFKHNLLNRAKNLLGNLVNLAPRDTRVRRIYALTLLGIGKEKEALAQLHELAAILEKDGGKPEELKEVYRRILALDKGNREVRRKLLAADGVRRASWVSKGIIAAAALILLAALGVFFYELSARNSFAEGMNVESLLARNDFEGARSQIRRIRDKYRFSTVSRRATDLLGRIDDREAEYLRSGVQTDMRLAQKAEHDGKFAEAKEIYERIAQHDPSKSEIVARARERALRFLTNEREAAKLVRRGRDFAAAGKHDAAYRVYHEVRSLYAGTEAVLSIEYPVEVRSVPAGARVYLNGVEAGTTPTVLYYSLAKKNRIRIEAPGFEPWVLDVTDLLPFRQNFNLQKAARWVFTGGGPFEASPILHKDTLYVASRDRNLYAIDTEDGELKFKVSLGIFGDTRASVAITDEVVAVGTGRGDVMGIDARYGRVLWTRTVGTGIEADLSSDEEGTTIYVTQTDGKVFALNPKDGEVMWETPVGAAPGAAVAYHSGILYIGSYDHRRLWALHAENGDEVWNVRIPGPAASSPSVSGNYALVGSDDNSVHVIDVYERRRIGTMPTKGMIKARPALDRTSAYFGSMDGAFYRYGVGNDVALKWRTYLGSEILGDAVITGDKVFVGCTDGYLYCLDRATGEIRWMHKTGGKVVSRPASDDDTVYVASMDGKVYAVAE